VVKLNKEKSFFRKFNFCLVNDRTRSLWIGTNGGHVYVYSIISLESQSINRVSIATDQTNTCSLGENFCIVLLTFFKF